MTAEDFLRQLQKQAPAPAYLFVGPETFQRKQCREALIEKVLPPEDREEGFIRHDLDESELTHVLDDARSFSLFARNRLFWISAAEGVLPRGRAAAAEAEGEDGGKGADAGELAAYLKNPSDSTVLVFDCSRYDFEGDDKTKIQRVQKFYSGVPGQVEFPHFSISSARKLASAHARKLGLRIGEAEIDLLLEALGTDANRIATEIEKLALFAGSERAITADDILQMVPNARATSIFSLVAAMGRNDRTGALDALDMLVRDGEYLPLALAFLATQFRLAVVAKDSGLTNASMIQAHFSKLGIPMWRSRAEQVQQTVAAFTPGKLRKAIQSISQVDRALRDTRPDDRMVMEQFVLELTR